MPKARPKTITVELTAIPTAGGERWALLRAGVWNSLQGPIEITDQHLQEIAASYDPRVDEAAINFDHVKQGKNLGVIASVELSDGVLYAVPAMLDEDIEPDIGKRYRRLSAEINFAHPITDSTYLTGVALLGAADPAVKGLEPIQPIQTPGESMSKLVQMTQPKTPSGAAPDPPTGQAPEAPPVTPAPPAPPAAPAAPATPPVADLSQPQNADLAALRQANIEAAAELVEARRLRAELAQQRAAFQVDQDLAQLGTRITPAMTKAGLPALLAHLATATGTVSLAEGAPAISPYKAALAILQTLPESKLFSTNLAGGDAGAPTATDLSESESQALARAGITDTRRADLATKFKGVN